MRMPRVGSCCIGFRAFRYKWNRLLLLTLVFCASRSRASSGAAIGSQTLRTVAHIRHLAANALNQRPEVRIRGVVTYYDPIVPNLFVQDSSGGIWVDLRSTPTIAPQPGQLIDLSGYAAPGFTPYIDRPKWKVLGTGKVPKPVPLTYEQARTARFDSQWVEMEGVVRSFIQQAEGDVLVIDVVTPGGNFKVRVPGYHAPFPMELVDAKVRFRGVCGTAFNRRNQIVAIHLFEPTLKDSMVLEPAPPDPFNIQATSIADVGRFSADLSDLHRVKVVGTVTARFPQRGLFLMDATGGLYAESQDGSPVEPGDEVEVIGFPAAGNYTPVLKSAAIHPLRSHHDLVAAKITGRMALKGGFDAQLVTITGTVRGYHQQSGVYTPVLESEDHVTFQAVFRGQLASDWLGSIGSKASVTGVCSIKADDNGNPSEFQIVLRTPADGKVLSSPPWLTARRALLLLSGFAILIFVVAAWVLVLRRRVRHQTEVIRLRLENEAALEERYRRTFERNLTGLYIANRDGTIIDCNDSCAQILGFDGRTDLLEHREEAQTITRQFYNNEAALVPGGKRIVNAEHRFQRRDGRWGWVLSNTRHVQQKNEGEDIIEGGLVDITDRKSAEERVKFLAYYDSLTGVANRTLLQDRLSKALANAKRHREKVGLLFLDLDRFKNINDSLGHSYGDMLLQEIAVRLQAWAREQDTVARLGGDEFIVALGSIEDGSDAAVAAERIARAIGTEFHLHDRVLNVTCSIGISIYPDHGEDVETLIKHADAAMYSAKEVGRNTFRFFTEGMNAEVSERLTLESSLRSALEKQQLYLLYQPQFSLSSGAITCFEALVRWKHPERGLVPPEKFIEIAENSGMIVAIGEWVLRTACNQAKEWQRAGARSVPVAVNVSAVQFRQDGFCAMIRSVLKETGLEPRFLELELTESLLLSNEDVMFKVLGELQQMGLRLAIDDFGTGYSSLNYLKRLPVSKLKIDRSFIQDVADGPDDAAITIAIINMAKCLDLKVTAEGVETEAQLSLLRRHACDEAQGFFFGEPLESSQVAKMLRNKGAVMAGRAGF